MKLETPTDTLVRTAGVWLRMLLLVLLAAGFATIALFHETHILVASVLCLVIATCDFALVNLKYSAVAVCEGRKVFWLLFKQALRFWSV